MGQYSETRWCIPIPLFAQPEEGYDAERAAHGALGGREPWLLKCVHLRKGTAILGVHTKTCSVDKLRCALLVEEGGRLESTPAT